ncbi:hypothetical protein GE09DRAFT_1255157 [Coniochaeta sp. 2T2.1]|nr:hypothetical protein GE09DRAFT_1255157 [Coniochaeta sp. 2T2.1]
MASAAESSNNGQLAEADTPDSDIAKTTNFEQMAVEAPGRRPFQRVYLWANKGANGEAKTTTEKYNPEEDGEAVGIPPKLPQGQELIPHGNAMEYVEVGLVIGGEPDRYTPQGGGRAADKARKQQRQQRGVVPRDPTALRAYIPVTDTIAAQAKYVVGCRMREDGRLTPRVIKAGSIFFYREFWALMDDPRANKNARESAMNQICKKLAASNQTVTTHQPPPITATEPDALEAPHSLAVSELANKRQTLVLLYSLSEKTAQKKYLDALLQNLEAVQPGVQDQDSDAESAMSVDHTDDNDGDGVKAFFDFNTALGDEDAVKVAEEVQAATPSMAAPDPALIAAMQQVLCRPDAVNQGGTLGDQLPRDCLGFFTAEGMDRIRSADEVTPGSIRALLRTVHNHRQHSTLSVASHTETGSGRAQMEPSPTSFRVILTCLSESLRLIEGAVTESAAVVLRQHGGFSRHQSLDDLMRKLGEAVDVHTVQSLVNHLGRLQLVQYHAQQQPVTKALAELRSMVDALLEAHSAS